ncbi:hypothetical protein [Methylobacterium sp. SyP6R]|uniref:hypothetical protein n=1 Tax=Methylobacterium sp. SyP6R TaxID=2718876 RepID=UPI001F2E5129|nr:hypothetical protein [Methylobacterium sp. SyP6R]MCF4127756.1 hypothetical protein [Methylobacterium sp. SyP6R]
MGLAAHTITVDTIARSAFQTEIARTMHDRAARAAYAARIPLIRDGTPGGGRARRMLLPRPERGRRPVRHHPAARIVSPGPGDTMRVCRGAQPALTAAGRACPEGRER